MNSQKCKIRRTNIEKEVEEGEWDLLFNFLTVHPVDIVVKAIKGNL